MDTEKTGSLIRKARMAKGLSQEKLAESLHVTRAAVSRWETGKGFPDVSLLIDLSKALDISIEELVTGEKNDIYADKKPMEDLIEISVKEKERVKKKYILILIILVFVSGFIIIWTYCRNQPHLQKEMSSEIIVKNVSVRVSTPVIFFDNSALMQTDIISDSGSISEADVIEAFPECPRSGSISDPVLMENIRNDFSRQLNSLKAADVNETSQKMLLISTSKSAFTLYDNGVAEIKNGSRIQYFQLSASEMKYMQETIVRNIRSRYEMHPGCYLNLKGEQNS